MQATLPSPAPATQSKTAATPPASPLIERFRRHPYTRDAQRAIAAEARRGCPSATTSCVVGDYVRSAPGCDVTGEGVVVGIDGELVITEGAEGLRVWNFDELVVSIPARPGGPDLASADLSPRPGGGSVIGRWMGQKTVTLAFRCDVHDAERLRKFNVVELVGDTYRLSLDGEHSAWLGITHSASGLAWCARAGRPSWWKVSLDNQACACCGRRYTDTLAMSRHLKRDHGIDPEDAYKPGIARRLAAKSMKARAARGKAVTA